MAISVENRKLFPHPVYFALPLKGFPLELGMGGSRWGQGGGSFPRALDLPPASPHQFNDRACTPSHDPSPWKKSECIQHSDNKWVSEYA